LTGYKCPNTYKIQNKLYNEFYLLVEVKPVEDGLQLMVVFFATYGCEFATYGCDDI